MIKWLLNIIYIFFCKLCPKNKPTIKINNLTSKELKISSELNIFPDTIKTLILGYCEIDFTHSLSLIVDGGIDSIIELSNGLLACVIVWNYICILDKTNKKIINKFYVKHREDIVRIPNKVILCQINDTLLACAPYNCNCIYIMNLKNGKHYITLNTSGCITAMVCTNNLLISASNDDTLYIWNVKTYKYKKMEELSVNSLLIHKGKIIIGLNNGDIYTLNMNNLLLEQYARISVENTETFEKIIILDNDDIVVSSRLKIYKKNYENAMKDNIIIRIWNNKNMKSEQTIDDSYKKTVYVSFTCMGQVQNITALKKYIAIIRYNEILIINICGDNIQTINFNNTHYNVLYFKDGSIGRITNNYKKSYIDFFE